jgi:hypothetical protein
MCKTRHPLQTGNNQPASLGDESKSPSQTDRNPGGSFTGRALILLCLFFMFIHAADAQRSLKITQMRQITFDTVSRAWSPWIANWKRYPQGSQPVITISGKDAAGYLFHIDMQVSGKTYSFDVAYNGFDDKNNWTKYMDEHSDEIAIVGSTMPNLSQYGWPKNTVQIYFWIYSSNLAMEME